MINTIILPFVCVRWSTVLPMIFRARCNIYGGAENAGVENAGVEIAREDSRGGNCRSGKYGSENVWKTVRTETKNSHQLIITDSTHPKERLKLELSNLVHREAISRLVLPKKIKKITLKGRGYGNVTHLNFYFPLKDGGGGQFEKR